MKTVTFTPFEALGKDYRGTTTEIILDRAGKALSIFRKAGTVFGNHYHSGSQVAKTLKYFGCYTEN